MHRFQPPHSNLFSRRCFFFPSSAVPRPNHKSVLPEPEMLNLCILFSSCVDCHVKYFPNFGRHDADLSASTGLICARNAFPVRYQNLRACRQWMQSQIQACERKLRNSNGTFLERLTLRPVAEEDSDHSGEMPIDWPWQTQCKALGETNLSFLCLLAVATCIDLPRLHHLTSRSEHVSDGSAEVDSKVADSEAAASSSAYRTLASPPSRKHRSEVQRPLSK